MSKSAAHIMQTQISYTGSPATGLGGSKNKRAKLDLRNAEQPQMLTFNTLDPIGKSRLARSQVVVRKLGFIFATLKEGQTPGLVGITQIFARDLTGMPEHNANYHTSVILDREEGYEEVIETQIELDYTMD